MYLIRRFAKVNIIYGIAHPYKLFLLMYTFIIYQNEVKDRQTDRQPDSQTD